MQRVTACLYTYLSLWMAASVRVGAMKARQDLKRQFPVPSKTTTVG